MKTMLMKTLLTRAAHTHKRQTDRQTATHTHTHVYLRAANASMRLLNVALGRMALLAFTSSSM